MAKGNKAGLIYEMIIVLTLASPHSGNDALNALHINCVCVL